VKSAFSTSASSKLLKLDQKNTKRKDKKERAKEEKF
jgi:hypothetical protein